MQDLVIIDQKTVDIKKQQWGEMGALVYKSELQLQAEAQASINSIVTPVTIEDVPNAEAKLKEVKATAVSIETKRKLITTKFEDVAQRLMQAEKSLKDPIEKLSRSIISIKQTHEAEQRKKQQRLDELKNIRTFYAQHQINIDANFKQRVIGMVGKCYEKALNEDVKPELIEQYVTEATLKVDDKVFNYEVPRFNFQHVNQDEANEIIGEVLIINQNFYAGSFADQLKLKFSDYEVAYNNKVTALAVAKQQETAQAQQVEAEAANQTVGVNLDAAATIVQETGPTVKALKKSYEIDMPETVESVLKILAAFSANINLCLPKLKITKWFAFTPAQAATVLGKVKNDDNNFAPTGIIFKEVDKL